MGGGAVTTDCLHDRLLELEPGLCVCAQCQKRFVIGNGRCVKFGCGKPMDDHDDWLLAAEPTCPRKEA